MSAYNVQLGFGTSAALAAYQFDQADIGKLVPDLQASILYRVSSAATGTAALTIMESSLGGMLPLAGGTMTGAIGWTYAGSNTAIDIPASQYAYGVPFRLACAEFDLGNGIIDPAAYFGWNLSSGGTAVVAGKTAVGIGFECSAPRNGDATHRQTEWHAVSIDTAGTTHRFITYAMHDAFDGATAADVLSLGAMDITLTDSSGVTVAESKLSGANRVFQITADQMLVADKTGGASILQVYGSAISGDKQILTGADETYLKTAAGAEMLTLWLPDTGSPRVMLLRTSALVAGGRTDYGLRIGNQSAFGLWAGTGAPTMTANIGSLYLEGTTGVPSHNVNGTTTWAMLASTSTVSGITASTTQTQGQGPLTGWINEVSTCANANDTVTLPTVALVKTCLVMNNGANTLKVYPPTGEDLGAGVNTSTTIAAGACKMFTAYKALTRRGTAF